LVRVTPRLGQDALAVVTALRGRHELLERAPQRLARRVAVEAFRTLVPGGDAAVEVDHDQGDGLRGEATRRRACARSGRRVRHPFPPLAPSRRSYRPAPAGHHPLGAWWR